MFRIEFSSRARKEYGGLEDEYKERIREAVSALRFDPVPARLYDVKKLGGLQDTFRIRIGKLRIVYVVLWKENVIIISRISFRESAYD